MLPVLLIYCVAEEYYRSVILNKKFKHHFVNQKNDIFVFWDGALT
ncbi:hypothetical protein ACINNAV18_0055 [Acinetobacter baumannii Naval-18]|nr:hypothetical protein ACIN5143_A3051 [Acinetobacter baumannii OIFC143]EJP51909.1 hypothetical protein ACINNAV18_0055 [Acinetobacter baumannii Naval-18]ETR82261.1 hypothetical protein M212_4076 [Acinetobacter baumannii CI79]EXB19088.1 hypothetical protein J535_2326 [Acinetobacter baumannii 1429530]